MQLYCILFAVQLLTNIKIEKLFLHYLARKLIHNCDRIFPIRDDAQKLERLVTDVLIEMWDALGDEDHVSTLDLVFLLADTDLGSSPQHILLVLDGVGVQGHAAARLHRELAHGEIRPFLRRDQHLDGGVFSRSNVFGIHFFRMFNRHNLSFLVIEGNSTVCNIPNISLFCKV
jgi:hypothetical protein